MRKRVGKPRWGPQPQAMSSVEGGPRPYLGPGPQDSHVSLEFHCSHPHLTHFGPGSALEPPCCCSRGQQSQVMGPGHHPHPGSAHCFWAQRDRTAGADPCPACPTAPPLCTPALLQPGNGPRSLPKLTSTFCFSILTVFQEPVFV